MNKDRRAPDNPTPGDTVLLPLREKTVDLVRDADRQISESHPRAGTTSLQGRRRHQHTPLHIASTSVNQRRSSSSRLVVVSRTVVPETLAIMDSTWYEFERCLIVTAHTIYTSQRMVITVVRPVGVEPQSDEHQSVQQQNVSRDSGSRDGAYRNKASACV